MFIIGYIIIVILRANHVVVPDPVGLIVGVLAILETLMYVITLLIIVAGSVISFKK